MTSQVNGGATAVVTGAASGIGRAIAIAFAQEWQVVAVDVDVDGLRELHACQPGIRPIVADVRHDEDIRVLFQTLVGETSPVRAVCNAAGIIELGSAEATSIAGWNRIMDVNAAGVFLCSKYSIPLLRAAGGGAIVNIASINAFMAEENIAAYCASKAAVVGLTRSMALDHAADGVRVNAVCPGIVDTPMARRFVDLDEAALSRANCLGRAARPEEIAEVAVFLASPKASFVTGAAICVDGGATARLEALHQ